MNLDDTTHCPRGECDECAGVADLAVSTLTTPIGVLCMTLCACCRNRSATPSLPNHEATRGVLDHCEHLGIDLDQMAAALEQGTGR